MILVLSFPVKGNAPSPDAAPLARLSSTSPPNSLGERVGLCNKRNLCEKAMHHLAPTVVGERSTPDAKAQRSGAASGEGVLAFTPKRKDQNHSRSAWPASAKTPKNPHEKSLTALGEEGPLGRGSEIESVGGWGCKGIAITRLAPAPLFPWVLSRTPSCRKLDRQSPHSPSAACRQADAARRVRGRLYNLPQQGI